MAVPLVVCGVPPWWYVGYPWWYVESYLMAGLHLGDIYQINEYSGKERLVYL